MAVQFDCLNLAGQHAAPDQRVDQRAAASGGLKYQIAIARHGHFHHPVGNLGRGEELLHGALLIDRDARLHGRLEFLARRASKDVALSAPVPLAAQCDQHLVDALV